MKIERFINEMFGELVTLIDEKGENWFIGNEVARILGYSNLGSSVNQRVPKKDRKALKYKALHAGDKAVFELLWTNPNDFSDKILINEPGLYRMIFGSQLESADEFQEWVCNEVLPSIRKNGGYIQDQELLPKAEQEEIMERVKCLADEVEQKAAKISYLRQRRHDLIAESNKLKEQRKKMKAEISALNECLDLYENMLEAEQRESTFLRLELKVAKRDPNEKAEADIPRMKIRVDQNGFII